MKFIRSLASGDHVRALSPTGVSSGLSVLFLVLAFLVGTVGMSRAERVIERRSMAEIIALVLEKNHEITVQNLNKIIESERIKEAKAAFDPSFEASYSHQFIDTPQNAQDYVSTGGGAATSGLVQSQTGLSSPILTKPTIFEQRNDIGKLTLQRRLQHGTTVELGTTMRVLDNTLNRNRPPGIFYREYESFTGITFTQPLLRDFGKEVNLTKLRIARSNSRLADLEWRSRTAATIANAMKLYYDVVFTYENMLVQRDAIELAETLYEENKKRQEEGVISPTEVLVAEAAIYTRKDEALLAETQYVERQNALQLLFRSGDDLNTEIRIRPSDGLRNSVQTGKRSEMIALAENSRYDILQALEVINQRKDQVKFAKNQIKPRLDLVASGGMHGLSGSTGGTYSAALGEGQGPEWTVGFAFSVPLGAKQARAEARVAELEEKKARIDADRVKVQIALEIDTILNRIETDRQRLATGRKSKEVARRTLDAEIGRLNEGVSTSYQVLQYQEEYSQTRSRELAAQTDLNKDQLDLWLATGQLLEKQGIIVEEEPKIEEEEESILRAAPIPALLGGAPISEE